MIYFVHIPKTAGTTLTELLHAQFKKNQIFQISPPYHLQRLSEFYSQSPSERAKFKLVSGHFPMPLEDTLAREDRVLTVLRNPIDRVISLYFFILSDPKHRLHSIVKSQNMLIGDFVRSRITAETENEQTRMLCGLPSIEWTGRPTRFCPADALTVAKKRLSSGQTLCGVTEAVDDFLVLLNLEMKWGIAPTYPALNVNKTRPGRYEVDSESRKVIEDHNNLDMELYRHAQLLSRNRMRSLGIAFQLSKWRFALQRRAYYTWRKL